MARIAGVDLPREKRLEIGLTYIYGIGRTTSKKVIEKAQIDKNKKVSDLSDEEVAKLRTIIEHEFKIEGTLRQEISMNIKRLMDISSYRGLRHRKSLPVRGQRTKTNARTRKGGHKRSIGIKKKT
ncbi:30S ribosomal protein S13 [bacterium]|nr:30S ribosomal protein S13 [bacterium]